MLEKQATSLLFAGKETRTLKQEATFRKKKEKSKCFLSTKRKQGISQGGIIP